MFGVSWLPVGAGRLGISPLPGRGGDYAADLAAILAWRPALVLTMVTGAELEAGGATRLPGDLSVAGVHWRHLPVPDFGVPTPGVSALWKPVATEAHRVLQGGGGVLAHCFGGCGRSGMAALRLMIETGEGPAEALERLRSVRPCAVETPAQLAWASGHRRPPADAAGG
jgi:protein-tyrosine phosphatase